MAKKQVQEDQRHLGSNGDQQGAFAEDQTDSQPGKDNKKGTRYRRPSASRNRDYSHHITWTHELNKDLYGCSKEADKSVYGYSGRLKKLWDVHHPKHSNHTAKHLATQA